MAPTTSAPGGMPNSSPSVTETAGACCTTTTLFGSFRASSTSLMWLCSVRAPVGQTVMHCPQLTQLDTFRPSSKAVPILAFEPRPMKSMAATRWISSHTRTHLPQRMHLAGSRTIEGLEVSSVVPRAVAGETPLPDAQLLGQLLQLAVAVAAAIQAVVGMVGQQQLDDGFAGLHGPGRMRADFHAVGDRKGTTRHQAALAFDLDDAHAAGAGGR